MAMKAADVANEEVFFDTNILIRLHVVNAAEHADVRAAVALLVGLGCRFCISRQTLREFGAVMTRPQPYADAFTGQETARYIREMEATYRVLEDGAGVTEALCQLIETVPLGGKQVHDANIAATMQVHGVSLVFTLNNADFERFAPAVRVLTLADVAALTPPS